MLAWEPVVEAKALRARGWTISAIARHLQLNRRTVRNYLTGQVTPGKRRAIGPDVFEPFTEYARQRLADDPHLWASALHDELVELGYGGSYSSLTRALRIRQLRPHCEPCHAVKGRDVAIIDHPAGEETQWDWLELPDPPASWEWGKTAHLLVGSLAHSSRWRGVLAPAEDQPHLIEALDGVVRRLGGLTQRWRFDRMTTVCHPDSGRLTATFGPVAAHYAVAIEICPARRGNRKGVVEKANLTAAQRWWRTLADELSPAQAQAPLDRFCTRIGDARPRRREDGVRCTVADLATVEGLRSVPTGPYPAILTAEATVSPQGLVAFRGNRYSVGPGHGGAVVTVSHRLGTATLDLVTLRGVVLARHRRQPDSAGAVMRHDEHVAALERTVLAAFTDRAPCRRKVRRPPSAAARGEAERLRTPAPAAGGEVVIDFSAYVTAAAARGRITPARAPRPEPRLTAVRDERGNGRGDV
jgi:transposase